jgi:inosose dehydratase
MGETSRGRPSRRNPRIAANPIPYWIRDGKVDKSKGAFDQAFADLAAIGFTAVKADVPEGMPVSAYADWIESYGLAPSLSLFSSPFDETIDIVDEVERAKRFAADQVALGLDRTMVSSMAMPARMAHPAVGADYDQDRFALAVENCGIVCQVLQSEGLRPLHHSHVGGVFETEDEIVQLLDTLGSDIIGVGPDTGHLRWAGVDPAAFIRRYADRIGGIHIKDCFADHLDSAGRKELGYLELSATKRLWAEAGRGVVDFDAVVAAMPENYDGDYMLEVDEPSGDSRRDSYQLLFEWAARALPSPTTREPNE